MSVSSLKCFPVHKWYNFARWTDIFQIKFFYKTFPSRCSCSPYLSNVKSLFLNCNWLVYLKPGNLYDLFEVDSKPLMPNHMSLPISSFIGFFGVFVSYQIYSVQLSVIEFTRTGCSRRMRYPLYSRTVSNLVSGKSPGKIHDFFHLV